MSRSRGGFALHCLAVGHRWGGWRRSKLAEVWTRRCRRSTCHGTQRATRHDVANGSLAALGLWITTAKRTGAPVLVSLR